MLDQVKEWMIHHALNPQVEVPVIVLRFFFTYKAKQLFESVDIDEVTNLFESD